MYFKSTPNSLSCFNHVKFMDLGMSCLEDQNQYLVTQKSMYLVESNFQTFFLRIEDNVLNYEISLLKTLKSDNLVLKLIKHKVIQGRFAGIYHFVGNQDTLYNGLMKTDMGIYDKLSYMETIVKMVSTILDGRNPQNPLLRVNILPSNLLMVDEEPYALKLITVLPHSKLAKLVLSAPEDTLKTHGVDGKASHVYLLGKIFYFMFFDHYPTINDQFFVKFLKVIEAEQIQGNTHQTEIFLLIRRMLNNSMVDRPGIMEVLEQIKSLRHGGTYFLKGIHHYMVWKYQNMKNEIDYEMLRQTIGEDKIEELNKNDHSRLNTNVDTLLQLLQKKNIMLSRIKKMRDKQKILNGGLINVSKFIDVNNAMIQKRKQFNVYMEFLSQELMSDINIIDKFGMIDDFETSDLLFVSISKPHGHDPLSTAFQFEYDLKDLMEIAREIIEGTFYNSRSILVNAKTLEVFKVAEEGEKVKGVENLEKINDLFLFLLKEDLENILKVEKEKMRSIVMKEEHEPPKGFFVVLSSSWPFLVIFIVSFALIFVFLSILILKRVKIEVFKRCEFNTYVDFSRA